MAMSIRPFRALLTALLVAGAVAVPAAPASAAPVLLSQNKPTTASSMGNAGTAAPAQNQAATAASMENAGTPASAAVDGNTGTRWSSLFSDPQLIQVDLGGIATVCQVVLNWEAAFARAFQIQMSTDGANWTT